jgi:hypothetical protein
MQQLDLHETEADPTITIKVKFHNEESQQFSSWERFKLFDTGKAEIVSEIVLKFEFIIKLPGVEDIQRYVVNIDLDSQLPLFAKDNEDETPMNIVRLFPRGFPSLNASIDFIDYLCAKNFLQVIEEWFNALEATPDSKFRTLVARFPIPSFFIFSQVGNIGVAAFIAFYVALKGESLQGSMQLAYLSSMAIVVWTLSVLLCRYLGHRFDSAISKGFIPSSIVLTAGDERAFKKAEVGAQNAFPKSMAYAATALCTLAINILTSYLYAWMTR